MITHPRFVITFTSAPGVDGIRSLRLLLKAARRRFGLIAIDAYEDRSSPLEISTLVELGARSRTPSSPNIGGNPGGSRCWCGKAPSTGPRPSIDCGRSPRPTHWCARSARTASKPSSMMLLQTRIFGRCTRRSPNAQRVETCCQRQRWSAGGLNVTARGGFPRNRRSQ